MKICRGILKGRNIKIPKDSDLRVTQQKVREALWSILYPLPRGEFLDLFSGSGIIAFEAYSIGFLPVEAVELNKKLCDFIINNYNSLNAEIKVYNMDVLQFLKKVKKKYLYIYIDPPYHYESIKTILTLSFKILKEDGIIILENLPDFKFHIEPFKVRNYGSTYLYFFKTF